MKKVKALAIDPTQDIHLCFDCDPLVAVILPVLIQAFLENSAIFEKSVKMDIPDGLKREFMRAAMNIVECLEHQSTEVPVGSGHVN
ncbi:hypothetical protein LJC45_03525 [Alistipes sp. OttesenSCG-928-B03]|nr:hypothetical protein [Alistipes sp. OttesenSCG-928-B03]